MGGEVTSAQLRATGKTVHLRGASGHYQPPQGTYPSRMAPRPDQELISTTDAARILGITSVTVRELLRQGALPYFQQGSHRRLLLEDGGEFSPEVAAPRRRGKSPRPDPRHLARYYSESCPVNPTTRWKAGIEREGADMNITDIPVAGRT